MRHLLPHTAVILCVVLGTACASPPSADTDTDTASTTPAEVRTEPGDAGAADTITARPAPHEDMSAACGEAGGRYSDTVSNQILAEWWKLQSGTEPQIIRFSFRVDAAGKPYDLVVKETSSPTAETTLREVLPTIDLARPPEIAWCRIAGEPINSSLFYNTTP